MNFTNLLEPRRLAVLALSILLTITFSGCGGGGGDSLDFGGGTSGGGGGTGGSGLVATPNPANFNLQIVFPNGTPGVALEPQPIPLVARFLRLFSSPALAQTSDVTIRVYGPTGALVTTAPGTRLGPNQYSFSVTGLNPGNYLFEATISGSNGGTLLLVFELASGTNTGIMNVASTAAALVALAEAPNGNLTGLDALAYNTLTQNDACYDALKNLIQTAVVNDDSWIVPTTQTVTSTTIQQGIATARDCNVTVVSSYPANGATGIPVSNFPIYVTFSESMDPNTLPPIYTDWSVETTVPSSGAPVTIPPANVSAYGSWSYSNNARTLSGVTIPANSLAFHFTGGTLNANSEQVFRFRFGALPQSTGNVPVTTVTTAGVFNTRTFYTGN